MCNGMQGVHKCTQRARHSCQWITANLLKRSCCKSCPTPMRAVGAQVCLSSEKIHSITHIATVLLSVLCIHINVCQEPPFLSDMGAAVCVGSLSPSHVCLCQLLCLCYYRCVQRVLAVGPIVLVCLSRQAWLSA